MGQMKQAYAEMLARQSPLDFDAQRQQELDECERWYRHTRMVREFREYLLQEGFIRENKSNDSIQVSQEG